MGEPLCWFPPHSIVGFNILLNIKVFYQTICGNHIQFRVRCILQPRNFHHSIFFFSWLGPGAEWNFKIRLWMDKNWRICNQKTKEICKHVAEWWYSCRLYLQALFNSYAYFFLIVVGMAAHSKSSQSFPCNWVVEALALRKSVFLASSAIFLRRNPG